MSFEQWLVYLVVAIGLSLTPGPNGLLSLTHGACFGLRSTTFTVFGSAMGFLLMIAISLAGFGALLAASEQVFTVAKLMGAAYLIYLGIAVWRSPPPAVRDPENPGMNNRAQPLSLIQKGFFVAISNPKGLLFFAAFMPQFMVPGASFLTNLAVLGGTFVIVEIIYELMLAGLAQRIAPWMVRFGRAFNKVTGAAFVGVGATLAITSERT